MSSPSHLPRRNGAASASGASAPPSSLAARLSAISALLSCWRHSLPEALDAAREASVHQVPMRAISELLHELGSLLTVMDDSRPEEARAWVPVMYAEGLADTIELTLWNVSSGDLAPSAISVSELAAAAVQVQRYVQRALSELSAGPAKGHA